MKKIIMGFAGVLLLFPLGVGAADKAADVSLETQKDKLSYSIGVDLGNYLANMKDKLDLDVIKNGIDDGFTGALPKLTPEEMAAVQELFAADMQAEQAAKLAEMLEKNSAAGAAYLAENKKKDGVKVTESGIQYEVLKAADGPKPTIDQTVKVHYVGTLVDGTEFDSSVARDEPAVFPVGQVIPGWSEAVQLMQVGSKYRVVIPSELAYAEQGAPPVIEPNSVLIFEIELLSIEEPEAAQDQAQQPAQ